MGEVLFSEAGSHLTKQKIPRLSRNPKVHYRVHNSPTQIPILNLTDLVQILTPHFLVQTNILIITTI
jgi:alanine dehydrogenase